MPPGRKRDVSRSEQQSELEADAAILSESHEKEVINRVLAPRFEELLKREIEVALSRDSKDATITRGRLIDRLIGKPVERRAVSNAPKIIVNLLQVGNQEMPQVTTQVVSGELVAPTQEELPDFGYDQASI